MIGEIALLIKGLDTACSLVRAGLDRKRNLESMSSEISAFFTSKEAVEAKIVEVKQNQGKYAGSALEEAIQIQNQEDRIADMMKEIGREYSRQGKSPQWQRVQKNAKKIQLDRDFRAASANRRKIIDDRKKEEFYLIVKLTVGLVMLMLGLTSLFLLISFE